MDMSNYTFRTSFNAAIPARFIKALSYMMSTNDVRYYLNGIHVKNGMMEAIDGHVAMRITSPDILLKGEDGQDEFIISVDTIKCICSGIKVKDLSTIVYITDGMSFGNEVDCVKGHYPDVSRILVNPDDCSGDVGQFDPELLMKFKKAVKALYPKNKRNKGAFELHHNGSNMGAAVKFDNAGELVQGVIMPWRV